MSIHPSHDPACIETASHGREQVIDARARDLGGGLAVRRLLPAIGRRMVGPFVFLDHMGPADTAVDVRPHPHIGLATVTYLFEGEIVHRDSLGTHQPIRPGAINWMIAGRGIVHSERAARARLHGLQIWVALPDGDEEREPAFHHHPADSLPSVDVDGVRVRVLAGTAFGATSPVQVASPTCYVDAALPAGARLAVPTEIEERAVYVVDGALDDGTGTGRMIVLRPGADVTLCAARDTRLVILGGAPVGPRHIWWNFVSSSRDRIEDAKQAWREERFPKVPGDEVERVPLPE